jgi:aminoglycoside phosphotransferase family enzyme/predicted kinase
MLTVAREPSLAEQAGMQRQLVAALARPFVLGPEAARVAHLETHISHVLLTGRFAYKIKKPVALGFLDFGTLAARKRFCEEELRLNGRLAPGLYLDVVAIGGTPDAPVLGAAPALEYAVKMREFAQETLASRRLERGEFGAVEVDALAAAVAAFHARIAVAPADGPYGTPEDILDYARQNFVQTRPLATDPSDRAALDALADWTEREFAAREAAFRRRQQEGFVRECHGDLHLGNIAEDDGALAIFDGIEFNDHLRWIDVVSEVAFATMDLDDRGRPDLAHRFLNAYLEATGDYAGLAVLRYYLVYRAMVRAKVAALRARQLASGPERDGRVAEFRGYLRLARRLTRPPRPAILVTHGLAGCGKTTATQALVELAGAIRVRTDVERKRLHGLPAAARTGSEIDGGLYTAAATRATYARVRALAEAIVDAGDIAIADGTFLARGQRELLRGLAAERAIPFVVLAFEASEATLRRRVGMRAREATDASEADFAVLDRQLASREPLGEDERSDLVLWDAEAPPERARDPSAWRDVLARLAGPGPSLAEKVSFLSRPASYPEPASAVLAIETHMSWVFLTDRHAWKLKKPVRFDYLDFATVGARERHCAEEVRLNRRLSPGVYLEPVPLTRDGGRLAIGGDGGVVDWLVKMKRLPAEKMLDRLIRARAVPEADLRNAIGALCRFYRDAPPVALEPDAYLDRLAAGIAANRRVLEAPESGLPAALYAPTCERLGALLREHAAAFAERVRAGRIVEGHGDLRPEHVCLTPEPKFIDCLEFARDLRILDTADELAFLALECERLGAPQLKATIFAACATACGDAPPEALVHFYQAHRALVRAKIALWHVADPGPRDAPTWRARAREYLRLARAHAGECG